MCECGRPRPVMICSLHYLVEWLVKAKSHIFVFERKIIWPVVKDKKIRALDPQMPEKQTATSAISRPFRKWSPAVTRCTPSFTWTLWSGSCHNTMKQALLSPFHRWRDWGLEKETDSGYTISKWENPGKKVCLVLSLCYPPSQINTYFYSFG